MAKNHQIQNNFNAGEISPQVQGRFDVAKFFNAVKIMVNFLVRQVGGASSRPGTRYVAGTKTDSLVSRLIPFQFNTAQAYLLELGNLYMRFFANQAQLITQITNQVLLCHFEGTDGQTTYTAETGQVFSFFGTAVISSSVAKFGLTSLHCNLNGNYVTVADSANWSFGTGNFTIRFWTYFNGVGGAKQVFMGQFVDANNFWEVFIDANKKLNMKFVIGGVTEGDYISASAITILQDAWHHFQFQRTTTTANVFYDGTSVTMTETTAFAANDVGNVAAVLTIGQRGDGTSSMQGYIDELQILKGTAANSASFTVLSTPFGGGTDWVTAYAYVVNDSVTYQGQIYICATSHTSGDFTTDLAAVKWTLQTPYELTTVYPTAVIPAIQYCQIADTMYLFHPNYPVQKLQRTSATTFTIAAVNFIRGPFLDTNITATTITPSADTGNGITLTASTEIFLVGHINSLWRVKSGVVKITAFTSATVVTGNVQAEPSGTAGDLATGPAATTDWAEGAWSDVQGYPAAGTLYQQRLYAGGTTNQPQKFWGTYIRAFDNYKVDSSDASAAVTFEISSTEVNAIRWLAPGADGLKPGTSGGTFSASGGTVGAAITATNINVQEGSKYGALGIQPKSLSSLLYYVQKNGFSIRELINNYLIQRDVATDMNLYADHILRDGSGAYAIDHQQSPQDRLWVVRNDGQLAVMTRNLEQEVLGWSRITGGTDAAGAGIFESVAIIQSDSADDEVWVIVKRNINGTTKRFVEFFTTENFRYDWDSVNLDCSLTLDDPKTITGATKANPVVITAVAHGFSNGDQVKINNVVGMTNINSDYVVGTNTYYLIANKTANTFELQTLASVNVNGTAYGTYVSGGQVRKMVTAISGLTHLNGETVSVQADGIALAATNVVASGAITLASKAAVVHVGLPYTGTIQLLKAGDANSQTRPRRTYLSTARLYRSVKFKIGKDSSNLTTVTLTANSGVLFTGDSKDFFTNWWDSEEELLITNDAPNPLTILALVLLAEAEEK